MYLYQGCELGKDLSDCASAIAFAAISLGGVLAGCRSAISWLAAALVLAKPSQSDPGAPVRFQGKSLFVI